MDHVKSIQRVGHGVGLHKSTPCIMWLGFYIDTENTEARSLIPSRSSARS